MSSKIYISGLPYATTDAQLQALFSAHGAVESARVITDRFTGRSRGFGFVEMTSAQQAQNAIRALDGTDLERRSLTVNEARPKNGRPGEFGVPRRATRQRWQSMVASIPRLNRCRGGDHERFAKVVSDNHWRAIFPTAT